MSGDQLDPEQLRKALAVYSQLQREGRDRVTRMEAFIAGYVAGLQHTTPKKEQR